MIYGMRFELLLPWENPNNTIGRPLIPFGKVLDGILHVLGTGLSMEDAARRTLF